ncbi:TRAP-type mannitol/chloroaromatic compound transport system, small permease component, partial [Dysosmobacter welbionis]
PFPLRCVPGPSGHPLAHRLIQQDRRGGGGIQGIQLPPHGDTHQKVAVLGGQTGHAVPLAADDDGGGSLQIRVVQGRGAVRRRAEDPHPLFFQILQQSGDVGHPGHRHVGHRSGGGLGHHGGEARAAALGDHHAVSPGALSGPDDGPQVVGVGDLVAHHQQGGLALVPGGLKDALHTD